MARLMAASKDRNYMNESLNYLAQRRRGAEGQRGRGAEEDAKLE
jgi:hypothetical protein